MKIQKLLTQLIENESILIRGAKKEVAGMARYATVNNPNSEYVKVAFTDKSGMYFPLDEEIVFYFDEKLGSAEGISDESIGKEETLLWDGKKFTLANGNDYQYVKELYFGVISDIEGEVRFSDYEDSEGNVLSLGWNMFEGGRDDVYAQPLNEEEIS